MKANLQIVPDYEVILYAPTESFRWFKHDYPVSVAKWHYHPEYELHLTRTTSGTMMVGDHLGDFEPGCLVLAGPNLPHNWVSAIAPGEVVRDRDVVIQFTADWADKVAGFCPELAAIRLLFEDSAYGVEFSGMTSRTGQRLVTEMGNARGADRVIQFLRLMECLARNPAERRRLSRSAPDGAKTDLPPQLDIAMRFMIEHYADEIDLGAVADYCGLAPQAFSRLFKRQAGHTFARYLILIRVYGACTLLTQSHQSITEICFEVGFNNIANFNRQFFKVCGRTPSDYRRSARMVGSEARLDPFRDNTGIALHAVMAGGKV